MLEATRITNSVTSTDDEKPFNTINDDVVDSVLNTLRERRLFRYDCGTAEGSVTARLEREFAELIGRRYAVAVNSCSSALFLSLVASGVKPGDEVLVPAFTFTAVPSSIVHAGAKPILVEMTDDLVIDCDDLERRITPDTKWLLLSHMRGRPGDLDRITEICERHNICLIEDCAHSLGVNWNGIPTGRFGRVAAFSAQSYKLIDAGEGGILVTDDREVAIRAVLMSGSYEGNWQKHFGVEGVEEEIRTLQPTLPVYNFRMSNLSAAAIIPQLKDVEDRVAHFNSNYQTMTGILGESPWIQLPEFLSPVRPAADSLQFRIHGLSMPAIRQFVEQIAAQGQTVSVLGLSADNARCFWNWQYFEQKEDCPRTREILQTTADLRLRPHLDNATVGERGRTIVRLLDSLADQSS